MSLHEEAKKENTLLAYNRYELFDNNIQQFIVFLRTTLITL